MLGQRRIRWSSFQPIIWLMFEMLCIKLIQYRNNSKIDFSTFVTILESVESNFDVWQAGTLVQSLSPVFES